MRTLRMIGLVTGAAALLVLGAQGLTSAATARGPSSTGPDAGTPPGVSATKDGGTGVMSADRDAGARLLTTTERDSGSNL